MSDPGAPVTKGSKIALGAEGEVRVITYLKKRGLKIVDRNFRCPLGEIDIIALHGARIVFVEVRTRRSARFGSAVESVDERKQRKLSRLAQYYLQRKGWEGRAARFDVIGVTMSDNGAMDIEWIPDAFDVCS